MTTTQTNWADEHSVWLERFWSEETGTLMSAWCLDDDWLSGDYTDPDALRAAVEAHKAVKP